jgi:hypothetical protein
MGWRLEISAPVNGRVHKADVLVRDDNGNLLLTDQANLASIQERERFARRLAARLNIGDKEKTVEAAVEKGWADALNRREQAPALAGGEKQPPQAERLLELAGRAQYFSAPDGVAFATVPIDGSHEETLRVRSSGFRNWLSRSYYQATGKAPSSKILYDVLGLLEARARYDGPVEPVHVRVAHVCRDGRDGICLDLGDSRWRGVLVTAGGWEITARPPVRFRRPPGMGQLPEPGCGGSLEELRAYLNVPNGGWPLVKAWALQALRPRGPYPVLCLHGEHGSAKSTAARVLRSLVDPSVPALRPLPRDERDLAVAAGNTWVLALDNLSYIEPQMSDALCRLATGGGFATRALYTDGDEAIFDSQRPIIVNGIEDLAGRADLLDRAVVLYLDGIEESRRLPESVFWARFELARPRILGALLDAAAVALARLPSVSLPCVPRMADFCYWAVAGEPGLGCKDGEILSLYRGNRDEAVDVALDASPVAQPLRTFVSRQQGGEWTGSCKELLDGLNAQVGERASQAKHWPGSPRSLSGSLKRLAPCLRAVGVEVVFHPRGNQGRLVTLSAKEGEQGGADRHDRHDGRDATPPDAGAMSVTTRHDGRDGDPPANSPSPGASGERAPAQDVGTFRHRRKGAL